MTGISGAGKASALKAFEDLGFHCVDNLPLELLPDFAALVSKSKEVEKAAIVVDVREGATLDRLPRDSEICKDPAAHAGRVSGCAGRVAGAALLRDAAAASAGALGDGVALDCGRASTAGPDSQCGGHADRHVELQRARVAGAHPCDRYGHEEKANRLLVSCLSFGFKNGVPLDADMVFDVRFLPNPHFVPEFRKKTGLDPKVAAYVRGFPQTGEFLDKVTKLMLYLLPHYVKEGKSYLTVAFGCTGGQHRSVMMAEEMSKRLKKAGYQVKALHRDMVK